MNELKTSDIWEKELLTIDKSYVYDPDGWDRKNYQYSWFEELISKEEFCKRLVMSTCSLSKITMDKLIKGEL